MIMMIYISIYIERDDDDIYKMHTICFQTFFVWVFKIVVDS